MKFVAPWIRWRTETEAASQDAVVAHAELHAAKQRRIDATRQTVKSLAATARLRHEIERNGWTELLQQAWGAR